ncbi:hypothetical protein [Paenibacillus kobensis]|uniref:hypothetical protein n=1 Tax=Paenibacillus kobensis TaxID=59841 RepID=UPI000FDC5AEA|nr:hypothetical protein [Paenibacillus kobensis]
MSKSKLIWIPAVLVIGIALGLLIYSYFVPHVRTGRTPTAELFNNFGRVAVFCGAASFLWLRFKYLRKSSSFFIRKLSRWVRSIHELAGYLTVAAIVVHGAYFLLFSALKPETFIGLAAFAVLLAIGGYGILIKQVRNVWMRSVHRMLSIAWIPLLLIHAGGALFVASFMSAAICGVVWIIVKFTKSVPQ